jgi:hypothetical protein
VKKHLIPILMVALLAIVTVSAFALVESDETVGGTAAPGPGSYDKSLVFSGEYDFSENTYDTNTILKLVNVPAGVLPTAVVLTIDGSDELLTVQVHKLTGSTWATSGDSTNVAATAVLYDSLEPTDGDQAVTALDACAFGFSANATPTEGKATLSVIGLQVVPRSYFDSTGALSPS